MSVVRPQFPDHSSPFSREQQRQQKHAAIIAAAAQLFDHDGVSATRLEDIAGRLGLTKTSIGYYFATKDELVAAVYRESCALLSDVAQAASQTAQSPADRLVTFCRTYCARRLEIAAKQRPYVAAILHPDVLLGAQGHAIGKGMFDTVALVNDLVQRWMDDVGAPIGRPEPTTFWLFGMLDWIGAMASAVPREEAERTIEVFLAILADGVAARSTWSPITLNLDAAHGDESQIFDRDARNRMKREAFINAGARLFNQRGFTGVSLSEIAASLGVSRGAFYYHITDKDQLLDHCMDRSVSAIEAALDRAEAQCANGLEIVEHAIRDLIYRQASGITQLLRRDLMNALPKARQRRFEGRMRVAAQRLGDAYAHAVSLGAARDFDPTIVEHVLVNALFLNGGYTVLAANSFQDWRISEDPMTASIDYTYALMLGLKS